MNKLSTTLFNDGVNNGNLKIITSDNDEINCSSFVLKSQTSFYDKLKESVSDKELKNKIFIMDYDSKIIKILLNKMYNDKYKIKDLNNDEIINLVDLIKHIGLNYNKDKICEELNELFLNNLTNDNWLEILENIYENETYEELKNVVNDYIINVVLNDNDLDNLFETFYAIDPTTELGKELLKLYVLKINKMNISINELKEKYKKTQELQSTLPKKRGRKTGTIMKKRKN